MRPRVKQSLLGAGLLFFAFLLISGGFWTFTHRPLQQTPHVQKRVQQAVKVRSHKTVVIFFRPGCAYCRAATPAINQALIKHSANTILVNTRSSEGRQLYPQYSVTSVPVGVVIDHGHASWPQALTHGSSSAIRVDQRKLTHLWK
ncbi:thioredoxin domain-containing protein [Furfurilactobacillus entadae]|uniref:thioredoxin domain-containing protein n=1 Tax=Furfurilactobacillus entadae TaxID=2922307 RepID=UPI0038B22EF1